MNIRVGNGYDVHALAPGLPLILGGISIPYEYGCVAHSDGDVVIHSLCDSLLGALALGDIGKHFPDTDSTFKDADSLVLLQKVVELIRSIDKDVIIMVDNCCEAIEPYDPKEFIADEPFVFTIRDTKTGTILFMGTISNLSK